MTAHRPPRDCPVCRHRLELTRLGCPDCDTGISGRFRACAFCGLDDAELDVLLVFLRSRGNMKELERHLQVSYPTARARFDRLLARLDLVGDDAATDGPLGGSSTGPTGPAPGDPRLVTLEALARGEVTVADAKARLDTEDGPEITPRHTD